MLLRIVRALLILWVSFLLVTDLVFAKAKGPKQKKKVVWGTIVTQDQLLSVQIPLKDGKKTRRYSSLCLNRTPGTVYKTKNVIYFRSYAKQATELRKKNARDPKISLFKKLAKAGASLCVNPPAPPNLSLRPYTGTFGEEEARILYDRFGFGGTPEEIAQAVGLGLQRTIQLMTTSVLEPSLDAVEADLRCDGRFSNDPDNETCDPNDPNDFSTTGARYALYYRILHAQRPFFEKLFFFLHDERLSASVNALDSCERYAFLDHIAMIRKAAFSGDYRTYMRDWNYDLMGHLEWLDGASNNKEGPNENYAREFWELGTVGPTDLGGSPVYSDIDIARGALAFTGWRIEGYNLNNRYICLPSFVPGLHAPGPHTIFDGTPWRAEVSDSDTMLDATFRHPRTAESLAQDLWKEFINPDATPDTIRIVANHIRENNYNLVATLRILMGSEALFSPKSRKALIKHPVEKLLGFMRTTGIPADIRYIDWWLEDLNQRPTLPPSVFGWDEKRLAGEAFVLEGRNVFLSLLTQDSDDWKTDYGYDFHQRFLATLPVGPIPALDLVNRLSTWLNVPLNQPQKNRLAEYLDFDLERCYNTSQCGGQRYRLIRDVFDPFPTSDNWNYKLRGALIALTNMPNFSLK